VDVEGHIAVRSYTYSVPSAEAL